MKSKTNFGLTILVVLFAWSILNIVSAVSTGKPSSENALFTQYGVGWLGIILDIIFVVLQAICIYGIVTRKKWGQKPLYGLFGLSALLSIIMMIVAFTNLDFYKEAYSVARSNRGLSIGGVDQLVSANFLIGITLGSLLWNGLWSFYVYKKREYFEN